MPGNRRFLPISVVASFMLAITIVRLVQACPFCPPSEPPLSEKLAESDAACVATFLSSVDGEELSMQRTTFRIVRLIKPDGAYKPDQVFDIPIGVTGKEGETFLMFGKRQEGTMEWSLPEKADEETIAYVEQAPSPEGSPKPQRLVYFFNCLGNANNLISNDAFSEFARADLEDVQRMIELFPEQSDRKMSRTTVRTKVRKWLADPNPQLDVRRGFYGMLLGMCGKDDDAVFLEKIILAPIAPDKNRFWIDGILAGYLTIRGETGLRFLVEKKLDALPADLPITDPRRTDANALMGTVRFLWDYRRPQFSEESLRSVMRRFLDSPEVAELVVADLARWKDWSSIDRLVKSYGNAPWETPSAKEAIVAFALRCQKDVPAGAGNKLPEHAAKAQAFLDGLDPKFVESVKQKAGGLAPLPKTEPKAVLPVSTKNESN
jgi:hypothetical protein